MVVYASIIAEIREKLNSERKRTGIGPTALMRGTAHDPKRPKTLKGHTISLWLSGKIKSARKSQIDYVLERWAALPDAEQASARLLQERVTLTNEHLTIIDEAWSYGLLPDKVLQHPDAPEGLNGAIIRTWQDRRIKSAAKTYLDFVMAQCAKVSEN